MGDEQDYEAVQYGEWKPWHAVIPDGHGIPSDTTFCGLHAIKAKRMYEQWSRVHVNERCKHCVHNVASSMLH